MDKDTLIASLVANYLTDSSLYIELLDEDFVEDPNGNWIKQNNYWEDKSSVEMRSVLSNGLFSSKKTRHDEERFRRHREFCDEINALPKHKLITTHEYRVIRFATKKANEIINSQKFI